MNGSKGEENQRKVFEEVVQELRKVAPEVVKGW